MCKFLFKFPTRGRPDVFRTVLKKYQDSIGTHPHQWIVTVDVDDEKMNNPVMIAFLDSQPNLRYRFGHSKTKIEAINADFDLADDWDVLVLVSDDMIPQEKNLTDIIADDFTRYSPSDKPFALNYQDGFRTDGLCTLSVMNRKMYEHFGYVYHPAFKSEWCDDFYTVRCREMKAMVDIQRCIIKHEWLTHTGHDALYEKNRAAISDDKKTYARLIQERVMK